MSALGMGAACAFLLVGTLPAALVGQQPKQRTDSCLEIADLGVHPDGSPVLPTVAGRVLDSDGRSALIGAHLRLVGTEFEAFSDKNGKYTLAFNPRSFDRCLPQYIQVTDSGHKDAMFRLVYVGHGAQGADVVLRKR